MAATVETTLFDPAGPLASHSETLPIVDDGGWIGISKRKRSSALAPVSRFPACLIWTR